MDYRIISNRKRGFLKAFHENGGFEIGDVFPFSVNTWLSFRTEKEAQEYLIRVKTDCIEQGERWGDWLEKALVFVKTLKYEEFRGINE